MGTGYRSEKNFGIRDRPYFNFCRFLFLIRYCIRKSPDSNWFEKMWSFLRLFIATNENCNGNKEVNYTKCMKSEINNLSLMIINIYYNILYTNYEIFSIQCLPMKTLWKHKPANSTCWDHTKSATRLKNSVWGRQLTSQCPIKPRARNNWGRRRMNSTKNGIKNYFSLKISLI